MWNQEIHGKAVKGGKKSKKTNLARGGWRGEFNTHVPTRGKKSTGRGEEAAKIRPARGGKMKSRFYNAKFYKLGCRLAIKEQKKSGRRATWVRLKTPQKKKGKELASCASGKEKKKMLTPMGMVSTTRVKEDHKHRLGSFLK